MPRFPGFSAIPNAYCYRCYYGQTSDSCSLECAQALEEHIKFGCNKDNALAFMLELVPGNGGHQEPPKEYFKAIREICDRNDVLLPRRRGAERASAAQASGGPATTMTSHPTF